MRAFGARRMTFTWTVATAAVAILAIAAIALTLVGRGEGGAPTKPPTLASVGALPAIPHGLGRCGAILAADERERRARLQPLVAALAEAGHGAEPSSVSTAAAGACQLAHPRTPAHRALLSLSGRRAPRAWVCSALRADRRALMRASAGSIGSMRRTIALFELNRRPGLDAVHSGIGRSERAARAAQRRVQGLRMRSAGGRELRREMRFFAADWANNAAAYRGGSANAGALVRSFGASAAVKRLDRWLRGVSRIRERALSVERLANTAPPGTPEGCTLTRISLFG